MLTSDIEMIPCPCGSGKLLAACCEPYLKGAPAPTAEALMRSRYTAYATGNFDHIERTCTGPAAEAFDRQEASLSATTTEWLGLKISATSKGGLGDDTGTVSFTFECRQSGKHMVASEVSLFLRVDGAWMYVDRVDTKGSQSVGRNDPCPCGSGKKIKKCCGAG